MTYRASQHKNGLSTSRPLATGSGEMYLCNDTPVIYIDDPATKTWKQYASEYMPTGNPATSYSTFGNISVTQYADTIRAMATANNVSPWQGIAYQSGTLTNTATWIVTLCFTGYTLGDVSFPDIGVCVTNGVASGSSAVYGLCLYNAGTTYGIHAFNSVLGTVTRTHLYLEESSSSAVAVAGTGRMHFRILNDGTYMHFQVSPDGFHWQTWSGLTSPSSLLYYGFMIGTEDGGGNSWGQALIYENKLTALTLAQQTVTACTGNGVAVKVTVASTTGFAAGDYVSVVGMVGNTAANALVGYTATSDGQINWGIIVTTINSSTQMTFNATGNGTWTSGGTITLLTR